MKIRKIVPNPKNRGTLLVPGGKGGRTPKVVDNKFSWKDYRKVTAMLVLYSTVWKRNNVHRLQSKDKEFLWKAERIYRRMSKPARLFCETMANQILEIGGYGND